MSGSEVLLITCKAYYMEELTQKLVPLGTLEVGERIGRGGFGEVFKAKLPPLKHDFAVKFLDPSPLNSADSKATERFIQEAEILITLRHPYITPIYGLGEYNSRPYIVMEYFPGHNLQQARENYGAPRPATILPFIEYVASALAHAHLKNIIHRDIKPTNLLTRRGDARVVDFGIAHIVDPTRESRLSVAGGTPVGDAFAAPELMMDPRLKDPRSEIYSLGACWYWLLTGMTPHGRHWEGRLKEIDGIIPQYEQVLLKMLNPAETRFQTMHDVGRDVKALQTGANPLISSNDDLDDEAALLLGAIYEEWAPERMTITVSSVRQSTQTLSNFGFSLARETLEERGFVQETSLENEWGGVVQGFDVTEMGRNWVRKNRARVESLIGRMRQESEENDIPF